MRLYTYLTFNGDCEEAFKFYERVLGGKIEGMMRFEGTPGEEHASPEWRSKIMHTALAIGDQVLMGSDGMGANSPKPQGFSVSIQVEDASEGERIFNAFADGGEIGMPYAETFWAHRFGMVTDRFGVPWMINCDKSAV